VREKVLKIIKNLTMRINKKILPKALKYCLILHLALVMASLLFLPACGKKGLPVPPRQAAIPAVKDLSLNIEGDMIVLTWTVPDKMKDASLDLKEFVVHRAKQKIQNGDCRNCPVKFMPVAEVPAETKPAGKRMKYEDRVEKGFKYVFKVTAVSRTGSESGDSNYVETVY
jgi:hypothetical protein